MLKKIVVTGGSGRLANEIYKHGLNVVLAPEDELNICDFDSIQTYLIKEKPDIVIHAAALTKPMSLHDTDINRSIEVNIIGTANVTQACNLLGIKLVYISTDYVYPRESFDAKETDGLSPVNNYGWSKLGGECAVRMYKNSLIIRLSFVYKPFPFDNAYTDVIRNMFYIDDAAKAILKVVDTEYGVINIGTPYRKTLFDLAKETKEDIKQITLKEGDELPKIMVLNVDKFNSL